MHFISLLLKANNLLDSTITQISLVIDFPFFPGIKFFRIRRKYKVRLFFPANPARRNIEAKTKQSPSQNHGECSRRNEIRVSSCYYKVLKNVPQSHGNQNFQFPHYSWTLQGETVLCGSLKTTSMRSSLLLVPFI